MNMTRQEGIVCVFATLRIQIRQMVHILKILWFKLVSLPKMFILLEMFFFIPLNPCTFFIYLIIFD